MNWYGVDEPERCKLNRYFPRPGQIHHGKPRERQYPINSQRIDERGVDECYRREEKEAIKPQEIVPPYAAVGPNAMVIKVQYAS